MVERVVPDFRVYLNGSPLADDIAVCLQWVEVQQSIEKIDMATVSFENPSGVIGDKSELDYGNELKVEAGWVGEVVEVFKGEIISIEPEFSEGATPTVIVRAFDKLHKFRREPKSRTFLNQKVSDVISSLASEAGLSADVEDTQEKFSYLVQNNQSNIDYVQELARRVGMEVSVSEGTKLRVKKPSQGDASALTLTWGVDLISFYVRKSLANVPSEVSTRYWDPLKKESVVEKAAKVEGALGPSTLAHEEAKKAFGDAKVQLSDRPCPSPAVAGALAAAALNKAALDAVKGRGTTIGTTTLKPGVVLTLEGLSDVWSGDYYVVGAVHLLDRTAGYTTGFEVQRTGT